MNSIQIYLQTNRQILFAERFVKFDQIIFDQNLPSCERQTSTPHKIHQTQQIFVKEYLIKYLIRVNVALGRKNIISLN